MFKLVFRWAVVLCVCVVAAGGITYGILHFRGEDVNAAFNHLQPVSNPEPPTRDNFRPMTAVNPFPPITDFPIVAANTLSGEIKEAELVLGVVVNGEARAYPINMLNGPSREILNDTLGGRAIAATW